MFRHENFNIQPHLVQ